jgi:carboxyl-terminal processing protease
VQVASSRTEQPHFGPEREADLNHILSNQGGTPQNVAPPPRTDLPPIAQNVSKLPPENWPSFDATKPDTDYQLHEGEIVLNAMAVQKRAQR